MKKDMRDPFEEEESIALIFSTLCDFFLWGIFYLASFLLVLKVSVKDLLYDAMHNSFPLNVLSAILLLSPFLFLIVHIIGRKTHYIKRISFFDDFALGLYFWSTVPFISFPIEKFIKFEDLGSYIRRVLRIVIWWSALISAFVIPRKFPECALAKAITGLSREQVIVKLAIIVGILVLLNVIGKILCSISSKRARERYKF